MGSPLLCDLGLEDWSRHPDSCLPSSAYCDGIDVPAAALGTRCLVPRRFSHLWCLRLTGSALVDRNQSHLCACAAI